MPAQTLIIHGWSDSAKSFQNMKKYLTKNKVGNVQTIWYTKYESREDNLTFNDVVDGLNDELIARGLIRPDGEKRQDLNVIVHSTGGLVIRHWIWRYYSHRIDRCPVRRLIMLAPANFGSPLAHRGKSLLGSIFKGRKDIDNLFEVGKQLLNGLEVGSPYQWWLAGRDIDRRSAFYRADRIQTTILVGASGYGGLRKWINKNGTDGTVVIAGTPLNAASLELEFCSPKSQADYTPYKWSKNSPPGDFAFGVLENHNHSSIVREIHPTKDSEIGMLLLRALRVRSRTQFKTFRDEMTRLTEETYRNTGADRYQQFFVRAVDDQDVPIRDFHLEFFMFKAEGKITEGVKRRKSDTKKGKSLSEDVQKLFSEDFHTHSVDPSYRRFLLNVDKLKALTKRAQNELGGPVAISMRIHVPEVDDKIFYDTKGIQNVVLYDPSQPKLQGKTFLFANTTTLVQLCVNRTNKYVTVSTRAGK